MKNMKQIISMISNMKNNRILNRKKMKSNKENN